MFIQHFSLHFSLRSSLRTLAVLLLVAEASACVRTTIPHATSVDASRSGIATAELERGRSLYLSRCTSCHLPIAPTAVAAELWPNHVDEMREQARLDDEETRLVTQYLVTMSRQVGTTAQR